MRRGIPDVTVVIPVYNTMPYLSRCLRSVSEQTLGFDRMHVVPVDDGSTDGSARELDRFAHRHPTGVTLVRQANSGGPASPCNRGLELARGRYVFFLGADDYLAPTALQGLVQAADRWESDVVLGRVRGVNSRFVNQAVYARTEPDLKLFESPLPRALSNTKLFRRELVERHRLRFPEDMAMASDQPFTIEACVRARRISVLADRDYYFAVRRLNSRNITFSARHQEKLDTTERIVEFVAELIPPGKQRDAVLTRHFQVELAGLLRDDFRRIDPDTQQQIHQRVGRLARLHLTDEIAPRLDAEARIRLSITARGTLADLLEVMRQDAEDGTAASTMVGGRRYATYHRLPALRPWLDVTEVAADWLARLDLVSARWTGGDVELTARSPAHELADQDRTVVAVRAAEVAAAPPAIAAQSGGTRVTARIAIGDLLVDARGGIRRGVEVQVTIDGRTGVAPMRVSGRVNLRPIVRRQGWRMYIIAVLRGPNGQLMVSVVPLTPRQILARLRRK